SILFSIITKSIELYRRNGFYDVIDLIWVIVIEPFLEIEDIIYICCGVEIKYREDMLDIL
ncbi:19511_t:CDS:1, partial [Rhizophagus irregularis]